MYPGVDDARELLREQYRMLAPRLPIFSKITSSRPGPTWSPPVELPNTLQNREEPCREHNSIVLPATRPGPGGQKLIQLHPTSIVKYGAPRRFLKAHIMSRSALRADISEPRGSRFLHFRLLYCGGGSLRDHPKIDARITDEMVPSGLAEFTSIAIPQDSLLGFTHQDFLSASNRLAVCANKQTLKKRDDKLKDSLVGLDLGAPGIC